MIDKPAMTSRDRARRRVHLAGIAGWLTILVGATVTSFLMVNGWWYAAGLAVIWWPLPVWCVINAVAPWWVRNLADKPSGGIFG